MSGDTRYHEIQWNVEFPRANFRILPLKSKFATEPENVLSIAFISDAYRAILVERRFAFADLSVRTVSGDI